MYIKGFDKDLKCRGFQFEIGKIYDTGYADNLELCTERVFHFCDSIQKVNGYYACNKDNRYCEIEVLGSFITDNNNKKCGSNKIKIVREIIGEELDILLGKINGNTGLFNVGNCNSGDWNAGNYNSGDCNTGDYNTGNKNSGNCNIGNYNTGDCNAGNCNSGDCNTGNYNTGDCNAGNCNSGDCNTGNYNTGDYNSGDCNTGDYNTGDYNTGNKNSGNWNAGNKNSGDCNSGDCNTGNKNSGNWNAGNKNSGDCNSGDCNTGNCNIGNYNSGNCNIGNYNIGNYNIGDWNAGNCNSGSFNSCDFSNGFFNTKEPTVKIFNIDSGMTTSEFRKSKYWETLTNGKFNLTEWVNYTEEEMNNDKEKKLIGGYLMVYTFKDACSNWWKSLSKRDKETIMSIPNFDKEIFKEITGIELKERENKK